MKKEKKELQKEDEKFIYWHDEDCLIIYKKTSNWTIYWCIYGLFVSKKKLLILSIFNKSLRKIFKFGNIFNFHFYKDKKLIKKQ